MEPIFQFSNLRILDFRHKKKSAQVDTQEEMGGTHGFLGSCSALLLAQLCWPYTDASDEPPSRGFGNQVAGVFLEQNGRIQWDFSPLILATK